MEYRWTRQAIADASASLVSHLSEESRTLVVPSCPEWTLQDLAWHLGIVQHFWAVNVRERNAAGPLGTVDDEMASDLTTFTSWCRAATAELLEALEDVGDSSPCWTWWGEPSTAGAVSRHQVQEAAVHAWDAANALGVATPLAESAAHDGVPEFLHVHRTGIVVPEGAGVTLRAADAKLSWHLGAETTATVTGDASQLVLFLNGRVALEELEVTGDADAVRATFSSIDLS